MNTENIDLEFKVYGKPETKGSTKAFVNKYTHTAQITNANENCKNWQALVSQVVSLEWGDKPLINSAVKINIGFHMPKPKNYPKKKELEYTKKPDIDKLIRPILDALTNVIIKDDSQIVCLFATKEYSDKPKCCIWIRSI